MALELVFAFDRDDTVDTSYGPVPVAWVSHLDARDDAKAIAIGNQDLVDEAGIDGLYWLADELGYEEPVPPRADRLVRVREWADAQGASVVHHVDDAHVNVEGVASHRPAEFVTRFEARYGLPDPRDVAVKPGSMSGSDTVF